MPAKPSLRDLSEIFYETQSKKDKMLAADPNLLCQLAMAEKRSSLVFFFFFGLSRAAPMAGGGSQAKG